MNRKLLSNDLVWVAAIIPILCTLIVLGIFYTRNLIDIPLAIVDEDNSQLSRALIRDLDATQLILVAHLTPDINEAQQLLIEGEVYGVLHISNHLHKNVLRNESPQSKLWTNGQWLLVNNLMQKTVSGVFREKGASISASNPTDPITISARPLYNASLDYMIYLAWAMVPALWQLVIMLSTVRAFRAGTGHLAGASVITRLGKLLLWFIAMGVLFQMLFILRNDVTVRVSQWLLWGVGYSLFVASIVFMSFTWISWSQDPILSSSISAFVGGPALAFSGLTFPGLSMGLAPYLWSQCIPLTHLLNLQIRTLIIDGNLIWIGNAMLPLFCFVMFWGILSFVGQKRAVAKYSLRRGDA